LPWYGGEALLEAAWSLHARLLDCRRLARLQVGARQLRLQTSPTRL